MAHLSVSLPLFRIGKPLLLVGSRTRLPLLYLVHVFLLPAFFSLLRETVAPKTLRALPGEFSFRQAFLCSSSFPICFILFGVSQRKTFQSCSEGALSSFRFSLSALHVFVFPFSFFRGLYAHANLFPPFRSFELPSYWSGKRHRPFLGIAKMWTSSPFFFFPLHAICSQLPSLPATPIPFF